MMRRKQSLQPRVEIYNPIIVLERILGNATCKTLISPNKNRDHQMENVDVLDGRVLQTTNSRITKLERCSSPKFRKVPHLRLLGLIGRSETQATKPAQEIKLEAVTPHRRRRPSETIPSNGNSRCSMLSALTPRSKQPHRDLLPKYKPELIELSTDESDCDIDLEQDNIEDLLMIDLTSPLGRKLAPIMASRLQVTKDAVVKNFESYCNKMPSKSDARSLRSQSTLCDDRWKLNNIHYIKRSKHKNNNRLHVLGKQARKERYKTQKYGLNKRSRQLVRAIKPCSVSINKQSIDLLINLLTEDKTDESIAENLQDIDQTIIPTSNHTRHIQPSEKDFDISICTTNMDRSVTSDKGYTSESTSTQCYSRHMEPRDSDTPLSISTPNKGKQKLSKTHVHKPPFIWEDLVADNPRLELDIILEPQVVDLTCDSDEESGLIQMPSPTQLLGNWHMPEPRVRIGKLTQESPDNIHRKLPISVKLNQLPERSSQRLKGKTASLNTRLSRSNF